MRKFSSYGPVHTEYEYYAPRTELIQRTYDQLLSDQPVVTGHYITIWAPRQTGKTWVTREVLFRLREEQPSFDVVKLHLQDLSDQKTEAAVYRSIIARISQELDYTLPIPETQEEFVAAFSQKNLPKPLILILDEFDALQPEALRGVVAALRNIYTMRNQELDKTTSEKTYRLHSVALIGVRSVLGVENASGSPFNIQRSVHIPNLTEDEVAGMFLWYEEESSQKFAPGVIERVYYEMRGQPGLTCWLGELLTETYNRYESEITMDDFEFAYAAAVDELPNNNIVNIVSKAKQEQYKPLVLELYETTEKMSFRYGDPATNFLYMNGVVDREIVQVGNKYRRYLKFPNPFIQKRLFNYFAHELYRNPGQLYAPLLDLSTIITPASLNIPALLHLYEEYLQKNRSWLFKSAPRRAADERIYEAVYHFNLYMYLSKFMYSYDSTVLPEFPTGNGQIDLLIYHGGATYGLEVKSFANRAEYDKALVQAAKYAQHLNTPDIWLVLFIEMIDDDNRKDLEKPYVDSTNGVTVHPVFVTIGSMN